MERVTFLTASGERIDCLLNPESVVQRRAAGLRARPGASGQLGGEPLHDDPLMVSGGGRTELDLDLLFDVLLAGPNVATDDVRDLTLPLWRLAEATGEPELVRFVWGKAWNVPGMVVAVAERLEQFGPGGNPRRSWLRLRLVRAGAEPRRPAPRLPLRPAAAVPERLAEVPPAAVRTHRVVGGGAGTGERLEAIAGRYYGDPSLWRLLARFNGLTDPTSLQAGQLLRVPPLSALGRPA